MKIKYGLKLWSTNHELYKDAVNLYKKKQIDYIEILYLPGKKENTQLLAKNKIPVIVHAPTSSQGIYFGDSSFKKNKKIMDETIRFADEVNAKKIIIHPDIGTKDNFIRFLKENKDERIAIENMPKTGLNKMTCLGYSYEEMKEFLKIDNSEFCLDFVHAIKSSVSQNKAYKKEIAKLMKLKPKIFHICGARLDNEFDEHLNLKDSEFDLKFIKKLVSKSKERYLTFEVPKTSKLDNDVKNMEYFRNI